MTTEFASDRPLRSPLEATSKSDRPHVRRAIGGVVSGGGACVLGVAMWLSPASEGHGTHEQLGLQPCNWVAHFDLPCPTCGMTTAFSHTVRGEMIAAFLTQPFGFLLAILTAAACLTGLYVVATGSRVHQMFARLWTTRTVWMMVALLMASWVYKILSFKGML